MYKTAISLFLLWLLGFVFSYTMGGFIHVLPVIAFFIAWLQFVRTRPAV